MSGRNWLSGAAVALAAVAVAAGARAAPVYIGLQENGVNSGNIVQEATGNGSASLTNFTYGDSTHGFFLLNVTAQGTPPLPEPDLNSTSLDATASHPGTISIYVTELNQFPSPSAGNVFKSLFQSGLTFDAGATVTESTYWDSCGVAGPCASSFIFDTNHLLSTTTFTSGGGTVTAYSSTPVPWLGATPIEVTEVFTFTLTNLNSSAGGTIDLSVAPEPTSVALLASGLLGLGALRRRKKS